MEDLLEAEAKEAADPGRFGHEVERIRRWCDAIRANEDSDTTDDDYRPPPERRKVRKEREENDLLGWESEVPFPNNTEAADFINADDILA